MSEEQVGKGKKPRFTTSIATPMCMVCSTRGHSWNLMHPCGAPWTEQDSGMGHARHHQTATFSSWHAAMHTVTPELQIRCGSCCTPLLAWLFVEACMHA